MRKLYLFAICIAVLSCKKQTEKQQSSEKILSSFVFKQADNAALSTDVAGRITADSVIVELPQNATISHLIPTIGFTGKAIEPANKTAQDFSQNSFFISPLPDAVLFDDGKSVDKAQFSRLKQGNQRLAGK